MVTVIKKSLFPNKMRLKINKDKLQILFLYVCQVYNEKRSSELSLTACKKCLQNRSKYTIAVFRTDMHLSQKSSKSKDHPPPPLLTWFCLIWCFLMLLCLIARNYSGPHFPAFGLNTDRYSLSFRI